MDTARLILIPALFTASFCLTACGSSSDDSGEKTAPTDNGEKKSEGSHYDYGQAFEPAAPAEGYTRIVAPKIEHIQPGGDVTYCQYVMAPLDHDIDILDTTGQQSAGGHHTVAYATTATEYGGSAPCTEDERMQNGYLGGTGGDGAALKLPDGVGFRLPKGNGIVLNTHFINTSEDYIDGEAVLDLKIVETDPARKIAGLLLIANTTFEIPASGKGHATAECPMQKNTELFAVASHMHEYGSSSSVHIVRAGGAPEIVSDTKVWSPEMTGNADWSMYVGDGSLKLTEGDAVGVDCTWTNTTSAKLTYPREMCIGMGFFLADGASFQACVDGTWL